MQEPNSENDLSQVLTKQHGNIGYLRSTSSWANYNDSSKVDFLFSKVLLINLESH